MSKDKIKVDIPGIISESGLRLCDDDFDIYLRSLQLFAANVPGTLKKMSTLTQETIKDYAINVHGLKGISEYIGAEETRATAKQLELMAKEGDFAGVLAKNADFIKKTESLVGNVKDWLVRHNS